MEIPSSVEFNQLRAIMAFKKTFFQKFGLESQVFVKYPNFTPGKDEMRDEFVDTLIEILNDHIPLKLRKTYSTIFHPTRKREIVDLRMLFMKMTRENGLKLTTIAQKCNLKCHGTVIHGADTANNLLISSSAYRILYDSVVNNLQNIYINHARINESAEQASDNPESANTFTLYPGEYKTAEPYTIANGRSDIMSKGRMVNSRQPIRTKIFNVAI